MMLSVDKLVKRYDKVNVLDGISFSIEEGEIVGFIGPNGAGKSTTMKCIAALEPFQGGKIMVNGFDIRKQRDQALNFVGLSIENPGLYPTLTGLEHIKLFGKLRQASDMKVQEIIDFTNMGNELNKRVSQYSMGMKQRLALSLALIASPRLLLLDEPTNGLDPGLLLGLREELKSLKYNGVSIMYSSHQLSEVEKICDRFIFIRSGKILDMDKLTICERMSYDFKFESIEGVKDFLQKTMPALDVTDIGNDVINLSWSNNLTLNDILHAIFRGGFVITDLEKNHLELEDKYVEFYK